MCIIALLLSLHVMNQNVFGRIAGFDQHLFEIYSEVLRH